MAVASTYGCMTSPIEPLYVYLKPCGCVDRITTMFNKFRPATVVVTPVFDYWCPAHRKEKA